MDNMLERDPLTLRMDLMDLMYLKQPLGRSPEAQVRRYFMEKFRPYLVKITAFIS